MGRLFGTDGVRGVANNDLTGELAMSIGRAAANVLRVSDRRAPLVIIASDTRLSSDMLVSALSSGLASAGADVVELGVLPTPAVAYLINKYKADAGVMVSASHNTWEYNGIKIFSGDGYKLPDALEEEIEDIILADKSKYLVCPSSHIGRIVQKNGIKEYVNHLKAAIGHAFDGMKIAVDTANGAATEIAKALFPSLGAEVTFIADTPNGKNINDGCGSTHLDNLTEMVKSGDFDAGIAFDGDADRCMFIDENGNTIDGDMIMAMLALDLKKRGMLSRNTIVGTIMSNFGLTKFCEENQISFSATKVGDRYVLEEMLLEEYSLGGEQSGHIIFRDFATTGDGLLTAGLLLSLMKRESKKLSELASVMKRYPQVMENIKVTPDGKLRFYTNERIREAIEESKTTFGTEGRLVARPSGTEPLIRVMAEGSDEKLVKSECKRVAKIIKEELE